VFAHAVGVGRGVGEVNGLIDPNDLKAELAAIEAESIGWLPLEEGAYLHIGNPDEE
jgi:hypothetical protein